MPGISNSDLIDLQKTTLANLPSMKFEVALSQQDFPAVNKWFQTDKVQEESGTSIERNIMLDNSGNARHVRLYQKSSINVADVQKKVTAPWVQVEGQYSIERREALRNRKPAMYIKLLESRRLDAMLAMADLLEQRAWKTPDSTSDDVNPRGLAFWLSKLLPANGTSFDATIDIDQDFSGRRVRYGGGTDVVTDKAGLDPTANKKWRNWAGVKTGIDGKFIKTLSKAFYATKFTAPMTAKDLDKGPASNYRIYCQLNDLVEYSDLARKANDDLGADLDKFHGVQSFNRTPVIWSPQLDADTDAPWYGVNHSKFYPIVQQGDWMREGDPMSDVELHNVVTTFVDGSYQYFCGNVREAGFVISNVLTS
jgi:hypothetical protein